MEHKWFATFEEREAYFKEHVSALIPAGYMGAKPFWRAFSAVGPKDVLAFNERKTACITAFPQDSLAFASPLQVIRAAAMGLDEARKLEEQALELFRLEPMLNQALRTLSGGETVRLALAKVWLQANSHNSLAIASPYSWLDRHNALLTETVAQTYTGQNKAVTFLALNGENTEEPLAAQNNESGAAFAIKARNLRLKLNQSLSLGATPLWADARDFELNLLSPCLITGENGAGKSLFVKALAKINGYKGDLEVLSAANTAPVRLMQQNTLSQSLFRAKDQFAPLSAGPTLDEFHKLRQTLEQAMGPEYTTTPCAQNTILNVKLALAAARLCGNPKILIMDEPEWGLSFKDAVNFVRAVINTAHAHKVPVMLVSHKSWWQGMAQCHINISKNNRDKNQKQHTAFSMRFKVENLCGN